MGEPKQPSRSKDGVHVIAHTTGVKLLKGFQKIDSRIKVVKDLVEKYALHLNDQDIRLCVPRDPFNCAGARCAQRQSPDKIFIINTVASYILDPQTGVAYRGYNEEKLRHQINRVDKAKEMKPGVYYIMPPKPSTRLGVRRVSIVRGGSVRSYKKGSGMKRIRSWENILDPARMPTPQ